MEVACGEHGEAIHKLVDAVNNGKSNNYSQAIAQDSIASSNAIEPPSGIPICDTVIVDIDLVKSSSNIIHQIIIKKNPNDQQQQLMGPTSLLLDASSESVMVSRDDTNNENFVSGFPTSGNIFLEEFLAKLIRFHCFQVGCNFGFS